MDYSTLILSLISILFGWLLAQCTGIIKDYMHERRIRKGLLAELNELQSELERTLLIYSRQLQIYSLKGIENAIPFPLSNYIFKNYYKDAVLSLNKQQRISLQRIHTSIESINSGVDEHGKLTRKLQEKNILQGKDGITEREIELWGKNIIAEFHNVASAWWYVKFHLSNPKSPDLLPYSQNHEQYLKHSAKVDDEIKKLMKDAKRLDRSEFEKIYNPESFANKFI